MEEYGQRKKQLQKSLIKKTYNFSNFSFLIPSIWVLWIVVMNELLLVNCGNLGKEKKEINGMIEDNTNSKNIKEISFNLNKINQKTFRTIINFLNDFRETIKKKATIKSNIPQCKIICITENNNEFIDYNFYERKNEEEDGINKFKSNSKSSLFLNRKLISSSYFINEDESNSNSNTEELVENSTSTTTLNSNNTESENIDLELNLNYSNYNCSYNNCIYGSCNATNHCECDESYETFPENSTLKCLYEKKLTSTSFFLEFFIPIGVGHLYLKRYEFGLFKIFFAIISCGFLYVYYTVSYKNPAAETTRLVITLNTFIVFPLYLIWHIVDIILFAISGYSDGNGISTKDWG